MLCGGKISIFLKPTFFNLLRGTLRNLCNQRCFYLRLLSTLIGMCSNIPMHVCIYVVLWIKTLKTFVSARV